MSEILHAVLNCGFQLENLILYYWIRAGKIKWFSLELNVIGAKSCYVEIVATSILKSFKVKILNLEV